jgi:ABC-type branched-subunit amino acid transport system substrate-binding protein
VQRLHRRVAVLASAAVAASMLSVAPSADAQAPANPFAGQSEFCVKHSPPPGRRTSSGPGLTASSITIVDSPTDPAISARFGAQPTPVPDMYKAYVEEINSCGGINGRKLVLRHLLGNPLAPDQVGFATAACLKVTEDYEAFLVVGSTIAPPFPRCVAAQHQTIVMIGAPGQYDSDDMVAAKGRIMSHYAPGDNLAKAFVKYALKRSMLKGRKVMIVGIGREASAAIDMTRQYLNPLKAAGIDAYLEILPCIGGTRCVSQIPAVVSRAKQNGVDTILTGHVWTGSTIGVLFRTLHEQDLRANLVGPAALTIHSDASLAGALNDAGPAAARFMNDVGETAYVAEDFSLQGAYRLGYKDTLIAKTCLEVVNRRMKNNPPWTYGVERFVVNGTYLGAISVCKQMRSFARAVWSLGNDVSTARVTTALGKEVADKMDTTPIFRAHTWYTTADPEPTRFAPMRFYYPCPAGVANTACMLATEKPIRARPL